VPSPALIPLAMLLFGLGDLSRIAVVTFTCSLINAAQAAYAIRTIPTRRVLSARLVGAKGALLLRTVLIPSVLPGLVAGWRITLSLSLIIVVVSEMFIGTERGLGTRISDFHLTFQISSMYGCIFLVGLLGYLLNKVVEILETHFVHWSGK
jgi:ABC-type nitrate/sulfonate/bicarbonate transport system permease component